MVHKLCFNKDVKIKGVNQKVNKKVLIAEKRKTKLLILKDKK